MIKSFRHKGLRQFFETGSRAGIRPDHAKKLRLQLTVLNSASSPDDLPSAWRAHLLVGADNSGRAVEGHFGMRVSGNWRLVFRFDGADVEFIDYLDYH